VSTPTALEAEQSSVAFQPTVSNTAHRRPGGQIPQRWRTEHVFLLYPAQRMSGSTWGRSRSSRRARSPVASALIRCLRRSNGAARSNKTWPVFER